MIDRRVPLELPPRGKAKKAGTTISRAAKQRSRYTCAIGLRELMGVLAVLGPLGTFISLWVLPESGSNGMNVHLRRVTSQTERARVIHLTLAGPLARKARFVLSREVAWEDFLVGVEDRLQLGGINRLETSAGEAIMSVEDLMHDDHLIIFSDSVREIHKPIIADSEEDEEHDAAHKPRRRRGHADEDTDTSPRRAGGNSTSEMLLDESGGSSSNTAAGTSDAPGVVEEAAAAAAAAEAEQAAVKANTAKEAAATAAAAAEAAHANELAEVRERARRVHAQFRENHPGAGVASSALAIGGSAEFEGEQAQGAFNALRDPNRIGSELPFCPARFPHVRIAMIVPWVGNLPIWSSYFFSSTAAAAPLVDFLVFHEGQKSLQPFDAPSNLIFTDLGPGGLAQVFGMAMGEALELPIRNATVVIKAMRLMFEKWPRLVAEYKPAFGAIFREYLSNYTHWGYCDFDMVRNTATAFARHAATTHTLPLPAGARAAAAVHRA